MKNSSITTNHVMETFPAAPEILGCRAIVNLWSDVRGGRVISFFLLFLGISTLTATSCKDECFDQTNPKCENYDPCYGKTHPSAKFMMEESNPLLANQGIWYADSVFYGSKIRFRSEFDDAQYKHTWYVGAEKFYTPVTPDRNYNNQPRPQYITISHVLEYTPNLQCFPDDDGKDSVAQQFRLIASLNDEFQTYGTFRGVLVGAVDSFDVQILSMNKYNQLATFNTHEQNWFINFHNRGDTLTELATFNWPLFMTGFFYNHAGEFRDGVTGTIEVNSLGVFQMKYKANGTNITGDGDWHIFKGRKIK